MIQYLLAAAQLLARHRLFARRTAITFLLSDDAADINGAILPCDGGWPAI